MVERKKATRKAVQFVLSAAEVVVLAMHRNMLAAEWYTAKSGSK